MDIIEHEGTELRKGEIKLTVIFDIEASCEDRNINPNYNMETIEIGAVKVKDGVIIDEFQTFIEPEYINDLTDYCTNLTGIKFDDLKGAPKFAEAIMSFHEFIKDCEIYSCGNFDKKFLIKEIVEKSTSYEHTLIKNAIETSHKNLKTLFSQITNERKGGMVKMAETLNIDLVGSQHRALDDAKNLAHIYMKLESIREKKLKDVFFNKINKIISSINKYHNNNYEINMDNEITCFNKLTKEVEFYNFLTFIDTWSSVMITDITQRQLTYISKQDLSTLRRFAKL